MLGRRLIYLTVLVACGGFYIAYQEWLAWFVLLLVLALPWFSFLLSLPAMLRFRAEPVGPAAVRQGMRTEVRLLGWCALPVPPFQGKLRLVRLTTGEHWRRKTHLPLPTEHCGGLRATPEKVKVYDYLGLIGLPVRRTQGKTLIVRPEPVKIEDLPDIQRYLARAWRPKIGGGFAENHELRLYRPGDSLNQVHWKLTAKTGKLILREPMEPDRGLVLVTMNLRGTAEELDRKFGRLLWLGGHLLEKSLHFETRVLTGSGVLTFPITGESGLLEMLDTLLCTLPAAEGDLRLMEYRSSWHYHIGSDTEGD